MNELNEQTMMDLGLEALLILVVGLVLWRIMARFSRKNNQPKGSSYFNTKYKERWRRK